MLRIKLLTKFRYRNRLNSVVIFQVLFKVCFQMYNADRKKNYESYVCLCKSMVSALR